MFVACGVLQPLQATGICCLRLMHLPVVVLPPVVANKEVAFRCSAAFCCRVVLHCTAGTYIVLHCTAWYRRLQAAEHRGHPDALQCHHRAAGALPAAQLAAAAAQHVLLRPQRP